MGSLLFLLHFFTNKFHSNVLAGGFVNALLYYGETSSGKQKGEGILPRFTSQLCIILFKDVQKQKVYLKWQNSNLLLGILLSCICNYVIQKSHLLFLSILGFFDAKMIIFFSQYISVILNINHRFSFLF